MPRHRPYCWLLTLAGGLVLAGPAWAGPEIFALIPETGPAGTPVQIRGKGLAETQHVVFAVGRTLRTARFRIVSDEELQVIAPEYYRPAAAATVAVLTPSALAVAVPAAVQVVRTQTPGHHAKEPGAGFYHVLDGGRVSSAESVALIESGGIVERSRTPAMHLVRRGGALLEFANPNGIVFYEPGAILGSMWSEARQPRAERFYRVRNIAASPGVGPFLYEGVPRPNLDTTPALPPWIRSVVPAAGGAGEVIALQGKGFARTTEVLFMDAHGKTRPAGFRIVSDQQLKVEIPDLDAIAGPQLLAVISTEGLTITIPRDRTIRPGPSLPLSGQRSTPELREAILWVGPHQAAPVSGPRVVVVARGGWADPVGPGATYFIQRGGRLGDSGTQLGPGGPRGGRVQAQAVYYEPGANVPEPVKQAKHAHEVPAIVLSLFHEPFVVLPGPLFRR
jgi:hypothetical protein